MRKGLFLLLLLATGCALLLPQPSLDDVPRGASGMTFKAGAGRVALTPVEHPVPLAGFGPDPVVTDKVESELHARAVSLHGEAEIDSGVDRVVLVSVDMLIIHRSFAERVRRQLADLPRTRVILTATHTHFGIGGFWKGTLPEWASIGKFDAAETARVASLVAACARAAVAAETPCTVARGSARHPELVSSRVAHTHLVDDEMLALAVDTPSGARVATLVFFAAHPTELYGLDYLSGAWPGAACEELEHRGGVALLFQQGIGDQKCSFPPELFANFAPVYSEGKVAKSHAFGLGVARAATAALASSVPVSAPVLRLARATYELHPPSLGACPIPLLDRLLAVPVVLPYWPRQTTVSSLRIGDAAITFAPFELCAASTLRAKRRLRAAGFGDAAVVSLADDWLGYAPDFLPLFWTTSGAASFGGAGIGYSVADRLVELGERLR
jgi:hypothetical protein